MHFLAEAFHVHARARDAAIARSGRLRVTPRTDATRGPGQADTDLAVRTSPTPRTTHADPRRQ